MAFASIKDEAIRLVESLAEDLAWNDPLYAVSVRQAIEAGLDASREGRIVPLEEARARLLTHGSAGAPR